MAADLVVVPYDPAWQATFDTLRQRYVDALAAEGVAFVAVEHVGSTSVAGLAAKSVVDCDVVVASHDVESAARALTGLGFVALGDLGVPLRWAFRAPAGWPRTNTYVVVEGSLALRNHLGVREVLRRDPVLRAEYAAVKVRVAASTSDIDAYTRDKSEVLQRILLAAGLNEAERAEIAALNR